MVNQYNWWCPPEEYRDVQDEWFIKFFEDACSHYQDISASNIDIYTVFGSQTYPNELSNDRVCFLFVGENQHVHLDSVDAILTFFHDTPKSIRLPLWMIYWYFYKDGLFNIPKNENRVDRAVMIVSHDNTGIRRQICHRVLMEYNIPIDSNFLDVPHTFFIPSIEKGTQHKYDYIKKYKYNICPENTFSPDYSTEKIFQALACGCIPIYWGCFPMEKYIIKQDCFINVNGGYRDVGVLGNEKVWMEDALIHIYATYLKMWSVVTRKLRPRVFCEGLRMMIYECNHFQECIEILVKHWKEYNKLWIPRPHFIINTPYRMEVSMEELAEVMYAMFKT